ncbi:MAG: hypothetical protein ACTSVL_12640 [Promethearchaeota archaeon]
MDQDNHHMYTYDIEQPTSGFFMSMDIYSNITKIDLAFDGGDRQLCYKGYINRGYSSLNLYFTRGLNSYSVHGYDECAPPQSKLSFEDDRQQMMNKAVNNLHIFKNDQLNKSTQPKSASITTYKYGLVHNVAFPGTTWITDDSHFDGIPYQMEHYSQISEVIARETTAESQIKSDLQFYNKDFIIYGSGYIRNVLAYTIYAHGLPKSTSWEIPNIFHKLKPSEIENLWYNTQNGNTIEYVHPENMIILAKSCWGMCNNDMAKAFIDYGASAFAGAYYKDYCYQYADLSLLGNTNKRGFWGSLCYGNKDVETASKNLITNMNWLYHEQQYEFPWIYGENFLVYGNKDATLA